MKKRLAALSLAGALAALLMVGCSSENEAMETKSYSCDIGDVSGIVIDAHDRTVNVKASETDTISITYCESDKEYYEMSVSGDKILSMTAESDKSWFDFIGSKVSSDFQAITVEVPADQLSSLSISTTNGDVVLPSL